MKPCPRCAEPIRAEAVKCRYCGSDLTEGRRIRLGTVTTVVGVVSSVFGVAGSAFQLLTLVGVIEPAAAGGNSFFPEDGEDDDLTQVVVLVAALVAGAAGVAGALVLGRRSSAAIGLFVVGAAVGLLTCVLLSLNYFVLALSVVLLAAAAWTGWRVGLGPRRAA